MQSVIALYLDEGVNGDTNDENRYLLSLAEELREHRGVKRVQLYVKVMKYQYAGQTPILYDVDGTSCKGLRSISSYVCSLTRTPAGRTTP